MLGALIERLLLRRLPGDALAQVLVTLGLSFMAADFCLMVWGGDPLNVETPAGARRLHAVRRAGVPELPARDHRHRRGRSPSRSGCCSTAPGSAP